MDYSTHIHTLGKPLLANGYTPLPLQGKAPFGILQWSTITIDDAFIESYKPNPRAQVAKYNNTGIRCDGLVAFDIDVLDEELANDIEGKIEEICGPTNLYRVGRWPKRLLLYRLVAGDMRSARTGKYGEHQVELLTGSGRQFAAFGEHPGTGEPYEWDEDTPLTVPRVDLPTVAAPEVNAAMTALEGILEATGLERASHGYTIDNAGPSVVDLDNDFELLVDGQATTWSALVPTLDHKGVWANAMRENGVWGDSGSVHAYLAQGSNEPTLCDFARGGVIHTEPAVSQALIAALPEVESEAPTLFDDADLMDKALNHWVMMADNTVRLVEQPLTKYDLPGLKALYRGVTEDVGTEAKPKLVRVVDLWQQHPHRMGATDVALRPDRPKELFIADGQRTVFNTYREKIAPEWGGKLDVLHEFLTHLIPSEVEREIFLDWHACKLARPDWRMHALMMVTPVFGVGRGTWFQIVEQLFHDWYVRNVDFKQLTGQGSQGQYNEYMADALLVLVNESMEQTQSKWVTRHNAYEAFKEVCDTHAGRVQIRTKYGKHSVVTTFVSFLIASNHLDAFAVEQGDRRLVILNNGDIALDDAPGDLIGRILAFKDDPTCIGALQRFLSRRFDAGVRYDPFGTPPTTPAKDRMISSGQSDIDELFEMYIDHAKGDVCTITQIRRFIVDAAKHGEYDIPTGEKLETTLLSILRKRASRCSGNSKWQIKVDGEKIRPWIIRNITRWVGPTPELDNSAIRAEIKKNGPVNVKLLLGDFPKKSD